MAMTSVLKKQTYLAFNVAESITASVWLRWRREEPCIIAFMFHRLCDDLRIFKQNAILPHQRTTVAHFRELIERMLAAGYKFVRPGGIPECQDPRGYYAVITFDDGYYDNHLALPVLEEFRVPAVFFISSRHVLEGKLIWSDALYRELMRRRPDGAGVKEEIDRIGQWKTSEIEEHLLREFGSGALRPTGDIDRLFTPAELSCLANHPLAVIGNHTANHAVLTRYSQAEALTEIQTAQRDLQEITGYLPDAIAYPNAEWNAQVVDLARQAGISYGFIGDSTRLSVAALATTDLLTLPRFAPAGDKSIATQCNRIRLNLQWYRRFKNRLGKLCS